jgi:speckle-type POZ protein
MNKKMSDNGLTNVEEVRLGLYRVNWSFSAKMKTNVGAYTTVFALRGSQFGRIYIITYDFLCKAFNEMEPYYFSFTLKEYSSSESDSSYSQLTGVGVKAAQPSEPKRQKIDEASVSSQVTEREKLPPLKVSLDNGDNFLFMGAEFNQVNSKLWEKRIFSKDNPKNVALWIDFGNSELNENKIVKGLAGMFYSQTLCDVHFHFKNGQTIGAHVIVLSTGSPVFATMFQSSFIESKTRIVNIEDIEPEVFRQLLICLYTGKAPKMKENGLARQLYEDADKYGIENLKKECVEELLNQLSVENAIELLIWSDFHSATKLFKSTLKFIAKNFATLVSKPEWMEMMKNRPDLCLKANQKIAQRMKHGQFPYSKEFEQDSDDLA